MQKGWWETTRKGELTTSPINKLKTYNLTIMNDDKLIDSFDKSLCMDNLADVCSNIGDACIDLIAKNEVIDAIPVLGLHKGVYIMYKNVTTARLIKKLGRLLYRTSDIGAEDKKHFLDEISKEIKDRGSEFLLDYVNRVDGINKIDILTNLIHAEVQNRLSVLDFVVLCKVVENLPCGILGQLIKYKEECYVQGETDLFSGVGLLYLSSINPRVSKYSLNHNGYLLLKYGLNENVEIPTSYPVRNAAYAVLG